MEVISGKQVDVKFLIQSILNSAPEYSNKITNIETQLEILQQLENVIHNNLVKMTNRVNKNILVERESDSVVSKELAGLYADILANVIEYINQSSNVSSVSIHNIVDTILNDSQNYREDVVKQLRGERIFTIQDPTKISSTEKQTESRTRRK